MSQAQAVGKNQLAIQLACQQTLQGAPNADLNISQNEVLANLTLYPGATKIAREFQVGDMGNPIAAPASQPGTFVGPTDATMSSWEAKFNQASQIGAKLDSMENQAMNLMQSDKKADQIKGQQMMQAIQQIMDAIMKAIQARGDAAKQAIQSSTPR